MKLQRGAMSKIDSKTKQATSELAPLIKIYGPEAVDKLNSIFHNFLSAATEILDFSCNHIYRSVEISKAIAKSSNPKEAMDLHADFAQSTVQDCLVLAGKLVDLEANIFTASFTRLENTAGAA